jgi:hypothetical protein
MRITIPSPPTAYNQSAISQSFDAIKRAFTFVVGKSEAVESVLLQDEDGAVWKVTVDTSGNLQTASVPLGSQ